MRALNQRRTPAAVRMQDFDHSRIRRAASEFPSLNGIQAPSFPLSIGQNDSFKLAGFFQQIGHNSRGCGVRLIDSIADKGLNFHTILMNVGMRLQHIEARMVAYFG